MVVGEAPGKTEDEEGIPFVGPAGSFLRDTLREIRVRLDRDAWITNALICKPPKNRTPDIKQIGYCRPNLLNAIHTYQPKVIVTLGKSALTSVLAGHWKGDIGAMERWTGWQIPLEQHWVCPTWHPAFLLRMRNPMMDRLFLSHLKRAFSATLPAPPKQEDLVSRVEILYEERDIYEAVRDIDQAGGWAAVDYETNCIKPDWHDAKIYSCAISNGKRTISFPWYGRDNKAMIAVRMFLRSRNTRKISSNMKMEERWTLKEFGHGVSRWGWDTMLASHCLDNRSGICSLKFQAFVRMGVPSYNEHVQPFLMNGNDSPYNRIAEIDTGMLLRYGGIDALLEYRLAMIQRKLMEYEEG